MKSCIRFALVATVALQLGGCAASLPGRTVDIRESPLVNPEIFVKGTDDQALYRYTNPMADIRHYTKVIIDPVIVSKDGELDKDELANYQKLANNAYIYLTLELGKSYPIVTSPEPGTMRVQMAITDADSSKPVRNTLSTFLPIGMAASLVQYSATGKPRGVGEITSAMKITDASTGELIGAALDRRVGGKELTKLWSSWYNADEALKYWAKRLSFVLCDVRGEANCVKPE